MRKREWNISQNNGGYVGVYSKYEPGTGRGRGSFAKQKRGSLICPTKSSGFSTEKKPKSTGFSARKANEDSAKKLLKIQPKIVDKSAESAIIGESFRGIAKR